MEHHYQFRTQLRLRQHLNHYSNKTLCLRKKLNRCRRRQVVEEEEEEEEEVEVEVEVVEEEVELLEKIVSKLRLLLHMC